MRWRRNIAVASRILIFSATELGVLGKLASTSSSRGSRRLGMGVLDK